MDVVDLAPSFLALTSRLTHSYSESLDRELQSARSYALNIMQLVYLFLPSYDPQLMLLVALSVFP